RPGVTWHLALWSPDFPRRSRRNDATVRPTPPRALYVLAPALRALPRKFAGQASGSGVRVACRRGGCLPLGQKAALHLRPCRAPPRFMAWPQPPYSALRGAPLSSAASLAAVDGGRCSLSRAYSRRPSATLASSSSAAPCTITTNSPLRWLSSASTAARNC